MVPGWASCSPATFKAGICALLVALPLGLPRRSFGAEFAAPAFRRGFKPALEILEAIPTVVLGLIAFATISPWLKTNVGTLLALMVAIPALLIAAGMAFGSACAVMSGWLPLWIVPALIAVVAVSSRWSARFRSTYRSGESMERRAGRTRARARRRTARVLDRRRCADADSRLARAGGVRARCDALAGAEARSCCRRRDPVFVAAIALGASRCLGETMIVLMASGNTPIADPNPLAGLRTISAELAVGSARSGTARRCLPHAAARRARAVRADVRAESARRTRTARICSGAPIGRCARMKRLSWAMARSGSSAGAAAACHRGDR